MSSCDHAKVIREINKANEVAIQLQALLLPSSPSNYQSELARDLFEESLQSLTAAISLLVRIQPVCCFKGVQNSLLLDSTKCENDHKSKLGSAKKGKIRSKDRVAQTDQSQKRRRRSRSAEEEGWTSVTSLPHIDGHQWRKYGQKLIGKHKFLRNYYRCTHHKDQECPARKTVQDHDDNHDPPKYTVSYIMQHTCKITVDTSSILVAPIMDDSAPIKTEPFAKEGFEAEQQQQQPTCSPAVSSSSVNGSSSIEDEELIKFINGVNINNWDEMMFGFGNERYECGSWDGDAGSYTVYDGSIWDY